MEIKIAPHMINKTPKFPQKQNDDDIIFKAVKKVIDELDPFDLKKSGAPEDEFDTESRMIASRIRVSSSAEYIARVICEVLRSQFMTVYRPEDFTGEAQKIREVIRADTKNNAP